MDSAIAGDCARQASAQTAGPSVGWRIDRAFCKVAREQGSAPAIQLCDGVLSYAELDVLSNRLGRRLAGLGVRSDDVVVLACEDVTQFAIGALAIMKIGAAYAPVDLRFPSVRGRDALAASAACYALAPYALDEWLGPLHIPVLEDAFAFDRFPDADASPLDLGSASSDIAYVCYTSGTSGTPKGALISHQGVSGLCAHDDFSALRKSKRVASCSTFGFDAIAFEVWSTLLNGACIVPIDRSVVVSPHGLAAEFSSLQIDCAFLTTSLFNAVVEHKPDAFANLELLVIGGEALDPCCVRKVFDAGAAPTRLVNGYGPTEATTFALTHVISPDDAKGQSIPIGRPLPGRYFRLLKNDLSPAKVGEAGELCLGGPAVALGYVNALELTREKFIEDPLATGDGARLYRTGDLCCMRPDGLVEYLGRLDDQIKVRGYRVEPLGVAALLRQIPGVDDALVLSRAARFGTKEIVAFVRGDRAIPDAVLRAEASARMPDYMVPVDFVRVSGFPLTANGKIDAERLLGMAAAKREASPPAELKATSFDSLVQALLSIWRRNTHRTDFGPDTPYDEVGDSFGLIGILLDVEAELHTALSPQNIAQPITIRNMARHIAGGSVVEHEESSAFYIPPPWQLRRAPIALGEALARGRNWTQLHVKELGSPETFSSLEHLAMLLDRQLPAPRHDRPITLAGYSFGGVLAYELARRLEARNYPVARVVLIDPRLLVMRRRWERLGVITVKGCAAALTDPARLAQAKRVLFGGATNERPGDQIRRSSLDALTRYKPGPLRTPVLLVRCTGYAHLLDRPAFNLSERWTSPWQKLAKGQFECVTFNCTHVEVIEDPVWVDRLASTVREFGA